MNCDFIAPFYEWVETAAFGRQLQKHRLMFIACAQNKGRVLVLGDGDGHFTQELVRRYPNLCVDSIELSGGMLTQAARRNVILIKGDAMSYPFVERSYEVAFTHFFLDCFTNKDLAILIPRISRALKCNANWIVSEFRSEPHGWRRYYTQVWLNSMYWFFGWATHLKTRSLPEYASVLKSQGFSIHLTVESKSGLITSEYWQR